MTLLLSGSDNSKSVNLYFTGTSRIILASFFDKIPSSLLSAIFSPSLPVISCEFSRSVSKLPYSFINFFAVLSPTPGSPGILSTESPIIPK